MFYFRDFSYKISQSTHAECNPDLQSKIFTVIIEKNKTKTKPHKYSIINAAKPLSYFTSIFGTQIVTYKNSEVHEVKLRSKIYTLLIIVAFCLTSIFVVPRSFKDTKADVPLNILTQWFGYHTTMEVIYIMFISTIGNGEHYLRLMKKFDDFDEHFMASKKVFVKERIFAISLVCVTVLVISCFFGLHNVHIHNVGAYFTLYMFILQGTVIVFFLANIQLRLLMLNELLLSRLTKTLPDCKCKTFIFEDSFGNKLVKKMLSDSQILQRKLRSHCNWFELMQMYDKTADCVYLFNKIYAGQAFLMFQSSLLCTVLIICRSLSPSLRNSYFIVSDVYSYFCVNIRPIYLAKMCDVISDQKNKTLLMLMKILVHSEFDEKYRNQLQTMINLVSTRRMEITCNVFTADLQTIVNFSGRVISYTVLMIQYFYMHVFSQ